MKYNIQHCETYFELTVTGIIEPAAIIEMVNSLITHEDWQPGTPVLVDQSAMQAGDISVASVQKLARACVTNSDKFGLARIAIIVSGDLEYGLNRMWIAFADDKWDVICNVFKSHDDALNWISL